MRDPALADQPPEVEHLEPGHPTSLPPADAAARRVNAFLKWFGDGIIYQDGVSTDPPLYARDLAALASLTWAYETGYRNGESSAFADFMIALIDTPGTGVPDDFEVTPTTVATLVASLRAQTAQVKP